MATTLERKLAANRRNAGRSTGPRDTVRTRLNALKHGILSEHVLIVGGEGKEDSERFEEIRRALHEDLGPVGALEELLVDELVTLTWRRRRVLMYETGAIRTTADTATKDWEENLQEQARLAILLGKSDALPTDELVASVEETKAEWEALQGPRPLAAQPDLYWRVFSVAEDKFSVSIRKFFELKAPWDERNGFTQNDVKRVVEAACQAGNISKKEFWDALKMAVLADHDQRVSDLERRRLVLDRHRLLASLPNDTSLQKVQRYEAHLSRQFYRALHELQRLQAFRLGKEASVPMAVDINVEGASSSQG